MVRSFAIYVVTSVTLAVLGWMLYMLEPMGLVLGFIQFQLCLPGGLLGDLFGFGVSVVFLVLAFLIELSPLFLYLRTRRKKWLWVLGIVLAVHIATTTVLFQYIEWLP